MTSSSQLLLALRDFLRQELQPGLHGIAAYHNRIADNLLGLLTREAQYGAQVVAIDQEYLRAGTGGPHGSRADLSRALRDASVQADRNLRDYLKRRALLQLAIDNPRYSGYRQARDAWPEMAKELDALLQPYARL